MYCLRETLKNELLQGILAHAMGYGCYGSFKKISKVNPDTWLHSYSEHLCVGGGGRNLTVFHDGLGTE